MKAVLGSPGLEAALARAEADEAGEEPTDTPWLRQSIMRVPHRFPPRSAPWLQALVAGHS